jgi:dolichol-phosphate mannosyltransferase
MMRLVILIPTYNEATTIAELLMALNSERITSNLNYDLIVIDDNSPDGTAGIVDRLSLPWVRIIRRPMKTGLGEAYRAGFSDVLSNSNYTHVVTMDADGSHRVADLIAMLDVLQNSQSKRIMIMGTRWMSGGRVVNWPKYRQLLSKFGTKYAKLGLGIDLEDLTGGFRIYSVELLNALNLSDMKTTGYCFQIEMACAAFKSGAEVIQVPITFVERHHGKSKMTSGIALEAFGYVTVAGIKRIWRGLIRR